MSCPKLRSFKSEHSAFPSEMPSALQKMEGRIWCSSNDDVDEDVEGLVLLQNLSHLKVEWTFGKDRHWTRITNQSHVLNIFYSFGKLVNMDLSFEDWEDPDFAFNAKKWTLLSIISCKEIPD